MGNIGGIGQFRWGDRFEVIQINPIGRILHLIEKSTEQEFLGKELSIVNGQNKIQGLIDRKLARECPFVTQLKRVGRSKGLCFENEVYYLLFGKPYQSLREESINRKFNGAQFSQEEVTVVLEAVVKGLVYLKELGHPHCHISSASIFIQEDRSVLLSDPWLCESIPSQINGYSYPSPQRMLSQQGLIDSYDYFLSDLFTLAMVLLQIRFLSHMDVLYVHGYKRVNQVEVQRYTEMIKDPVLQSQIVTMLSNEPTHRAQVTFTYLKKVPSRNFVALQRRRFNQTFRIFKDKSQNKKRKYDKDDDLNIKEWQI